MTSRRRWLQFSLRGFFVLLTTLAVWLGVIVNRAREQREAVTAIEALEASVGYDWQDVPLDPADPFPIDRPLTPPGPAWLRRLIGNEFFQNVVMTSFFSETDVLKSIAHLKRLRKLKTVTVTPFASDATMDQLKAALPNCKVVVVR
ncbi:MAG TPA: hypothetical protein VMV10_11880 [Pirellulales bacterium]|nr:hypothetical protein [Pirellulales bacterium]